MTNNDEADPAIVSANRITNLFAIPYPYNKERCAALIRAAYAPLTRQAAAAEGLAEALQRICTADSPFEGCEPLTIGEWNTERIRRVKNELAAYRARLADLCRQIVADFELFQSEQDDEESEGEQ